MRKIFFILCIMPVLVASCVKEAMPRAPYVKVEGNEISVTASLPEGWSVLDTKAQIESQSDLQNASNGGFGMFAYYTKTNDYTNITSAQGVIFNNRQATYNASKWGYGAASEYWPTKEGEKVSFFAYAPYNDWSASVSTAGDAPTIPYTVMGALSAANIGNQKDLLWGVQSTGSPYRNVTKASTGGVVDFHFRHAISKMRFFVAASTGEGITEPASPEYRDMGNWATTAYPGSSTHAASPRYNGSSERNSTERTQRRSGYRYYTVSSPKYFVNSLVVGGLYTSGTLNLNNGDAYVPAWGSLSGSSSYTIDSSHLLNSTLSNTNQSGIIEDLTSVMSNNAYYIYVLPGSTASFALNYTPINTVQTYRIPVYEWRFQRRATSGSNWQNNDSYTVESWYEDNGSPSAQGGVSTTSGSASTVNATMSGPILPSRKYDINLHLQGAKVELVVVPRRWELEETTYDYSDEENDIIQYLTYDSDYIDYAVGGNVYINNRLGRFYFCLGEGKYKYWQASLVAAEESEVFAFCDSEGNFLYDSGGHLQSIIRGAIDGSMSYIYIRALDPSSTSGGKAKLRIYLFDSDEVPTIALDLVNMTGVTEWMVVQNAN